MGASKAKVRRRPDGAARKSNGRDMEGLQLLPVIQKESDHPCFECAACCKYVALEIDEPTTMKEYDYIRWYLYHAGVSVFVDFENAWYIKFETRCDNLTSQGLCGIYDTRPKLCRDFDWRECERHVTDEPADKWLFETADAFVEWLARQRPKTYAKFRQYQKKLKRKGEEKELKRVKITQLLPAPPAR